MTLKRPQRSQSIFITDCEGPISKNDNAFELATHLVPNGARFFALVSKYDDVLADVVKKPGYKAGDTLKLIIPFLKAYGATNQKIKDYSSRHVLLVPGAKETLLLINSILPSFIVSTSYEQYIASLCDLTGFPFSNVYCTRLDIDKYEINEKETRRLKELSEEISAMAMIEIPGGIQSIRGFPKQDQKTITRLSEIFWKEIPRMASGRMLKEVNPVGGYEKANAVQDIIKKLNGDFSSVMYIGDSITDVSPFQLVRENGGLTVSFNGNRYAIREAEIAVLSSNTIVTSVFANVFNKNGKEGAIKLAKKWSYAALSKYVDPHLSEQVIKLWPTKLPQVEVITNRNRERLAKESSVFRKTVRGEVVGKLG